MGGDLTMTKSSEQDWDFFDEGEQQFIYWFHDFYGKFSLRSEYFYGDVEIKDEKTRRDLLYKWIQSAFHEGYERGRYAELEAQQNQLGGTL